MAIRNSKFLKSIPLKAGRRTPCFLYYFSSRGSAERGFGVIEIIVVISIVTVALFGLLQAQTLGVRLLEREKEYMEAEVLAEEGLEAARSVRDEAWTNISGTSFDVPYYPVVVNGKWKLQGASPGAISGRYSRALFFQRVYRNGSDQIASSGTEDVNTKKVISRVSWGSGQIDLPTYITNFQASLSLSAESKSLYYEDAPTEADLIRFPSQNLGEGDPAQAFTTGSASAIEATKVELLMRGASSAPSSVYAELRSSPTGAVLGASQAISGYSIASTSAQWIEFRFNPAVYLATSTKYYIRLRSIPSSTSAGSGSSGSLIWAYRLTSGSGPYAGGEARRYIGKSGNPSDLGEALDAYDFGFRVYAQ